MKDIHTSPERFLTYATIFTLLRASLIVPIVWSMTEHLNLYAFFLGVVAIGTDFIDGYLARRMKEETRIGARLDQMTDKVLAVAIAGMLFWQGQSQSVNWLLALWFITACLTVGFQIACFVSGKKIPVDRWDKLVAVLGSLALILLLSPFPPFVPLAVMCVALVGWFLIALRAVSRIEDLK